MTQLPGQTPTPARRGRWRSGEQSRQRVLSAARSRFASDGYDRTTVRAIATEARVDPSVIHYFFGTKQQLFAAAMRMPEAAVERISTLLDLGLDDFAPRLLTHFLRLWDAAEDFEPLVALVRSAPTHGESATMLQHLIHEQLGVRLARSLSAEDAALRVGLFSTQLIGLAVSRYLVRTEPITSADPQTLVRWLGPVLQGYLTGPAPVPPPEGQDRKDARRSQDQEY
jgi:AcrR family transcriptional regulator